MARPSLSDPHPQPVHRARRVIHALFALSLGLTAAPLLYEVLSLGVANWQGMSGRIGHVETPILDSLRSFGSDSLRLARVRTNSVFRGLPWEPAMVIGLGFAWALFIASTLRRER